MTVCMWGQKRRGVRNDSQVSAGAPGAQSCSALGAGGRLEGSRWGWRVRLWSTTPLEVWSGRAPRGGRQPGRRGAAEAAHRKPEKKAAVDYGGKASPSQRPRPASPQPVWPLKHPLAWAQGGSRLSNLWGGPVNHKPSPHPPDSADSHCVHEATRSVPTSFLGAPPVPQFPSSG